MLGLRPSQARVLGLGTGGFQLRLRLLHVGDCHRAALIEILGQRERPRIVGDGVIEQPLLDVQAPQREVVRGEFGVHRQIQRCRVSCGGLLAVARTGDGVAHAAKKIDLVGEVGAKGKEIPGAGPAGHIGGDVERGAFAGRTGVRSQGREPAGARGAGLRTRLLETRKGSLEVLVGVTHL